jgi:hypothetical protein
VESTTDERVRAVKRIKRKQRFQRKEVGPDNWALNEGVLFLGRVQEAEVVHVSGRVNTGKPSSLN